MKRDSIMPSAVDSKSSEAWMLIMSDVLIWPLGSSVLTCSFTSHPNAVSVPSCIRRISFCLLLQASFKPSPPLLWIQQAMAARPEVLCRSLFVKGR